MDNLKNMNLDGVKNIDKMMAMKNVQDGMDAKKNKKSHVCNNLIQCMLGLIMVIVGGIYYNDCEFDATTYLVVGGAVMLATNLLSIVAILTPMKWDDKLAKALTPIISLAQLCIFLWGTIVVFGHYAGWVYGEAEKETELTNDKWEDNEKYYCAYDPYMFAFVLLILKWILLPLMCLGCCCCATFACCCACCAGAGGDGGGAVEPAKSEEQPEKQMEA